MLQISFDISLEVLSIKEIVFRFKYTSFHGLGDYVININGIYADPNLKQYWHLLDGTTLQPLDYGISTYVPTNNEIILFNFTTWN